MTDLLDESETHVMNPAREHVWMILSQTTQEVQPLDLLLPSSTEQSYANDFSRGAVCDEYRFSLSLTMRPIIFLGQICPQNMVK